LKTSFTNNKREQKKKEWLHIKATKRKNKFQSFNSVDAKLKAVQVDKDQKLIEKLKEQVFSQFSQLIVPGVNDIIIEIPQNFCFVGHYPECMKAIRDFAGALYDYLGMEVTLDFSKCQKADVSALFVLQIVRLEIDEKLQIMQNKLSTLSILPQIKVKLPKSRDVIRLMAVAGYPISSDGFKDLDNDSTLVPIHNMGYLKGSASQKHYLENKKSVFTSYVVKYLNSCLDEHGYMLTDSETNNIDGIISEILSNAEDHSGTKYWYITANFSKEVSGSGSDAIGELNLTILNFGFSIYQAFQETKVLNSEMYNEVSEYVRTLLSTYKNLPFSEEQLFTLATMQEQVSRLKFERSSRGTGTMKFINSFLELGDYEDRKKGFIPNLSIFSGNVHLICDNTFKPFEKENVYCLSLNPENDLNIPPRASHLRKLSETFPGTLLSVKIYLNKNHLDRKYGGDHERN
jgi:hypothetical protein